ncbi:hypothetical protein QD712_25640 [Streptomyces acidiscabies]|uniref:hypothetical protein n=1 Tax=Streptomyces acidiscabies TaxID=42234 RepID=UPI0030D62611
MSLDFDADDIAAMREQGNFRDFLDQITGRTTKPAPHAVEPAAPGYHIRRPGAWPCGTAASGPAPAPCSACQGDTP